MVPVWGIDGVFFMRWLGLIILMSAGFARADISFEYDGHTYRVVTSSKTFDEAWVHAESLTLGDSRLPGYLANINSAAENEAIFSALQAIQSDVFSTTSAYDGGGSAYVWIGADDIDTEREWFWRSDRAGDESVQFWSGDYTGNAVGGAYVNWGTDGVLQNEPDNYDGAQDAGALALQTWPNPDLNYGFVLGAAGQWNDLDPTNRLFFVVEWNAILDDAPETGGEGLSERFKVLTEAVQSVRGR